MIDLNSHDLNSNHGFHNRFDYVIRQDKVASMPVQVYVGRITSLDDNPLLEEVAGRFDRIGDMLGIEADWEGRSRNLTLLQEGTPESAVPVIAGSLPNGLSVGKYAISITANLVDMVTLTPEETVKTPASIMDLQGEYGRLQLESRAHIEKVLAFDEASETAYWRQKWLIDYTARISADRQS